VQFPRCRATVSGEIAAGHWNFPGRPPAISDAGWLEQLSAQPIANCQLPLAQDPHSPSQGDRREPSTLTLSREKEDGMRATSRFHFLLLGCSRAASAAGPKVKVVGPPIRSPVSGAQVSLFSRQTLLQANRRAPNFHDFRRGNRRLRRLVPGNYRVEILAPGFAPQTEEVPLLTM